MKFEEKIKQRFLYSNSSNPLKFLYFFLQRFRLKGLKKNYTITGVDLLLERFLRILTLIKESTLTLVVITHFLIIILIFCIKMAGQE